MGACEVAGGGGQLRGFVLGGDPVGPTSSGRVGDWGLCPGSPLVALGGTCLRLMSLYGRWWRGSAPGVCVGGRPYGSYRPWIEWEVGNCEVVWSVLVSVENPRTL